VPARVEKRKRLPCKEMARRRGPPRRARGRPEVTVGDNKCRAGGEAAHFTRPGLGALCAGTCRRPFGGPSGVRREVTMDRRNVAVALAVLQATAVAGAAQTNFELALDTAIEESLRPRDPQSADLWRLAAEAGYRRDLDEAVRLYDELLTRDPSCAPALWAKGGALVERGRREAGIALGRQAIDVDPSPVNLAALSLMLGGKRATDAEKGEAFELASRAASTLSPHPTSRPEDAAVNLALCRAAMDVPGHSSDAYLAAHRLSEIAGPEASACRAGVLAMTGRKAAAAREIGAAREAERRETAANRARREERAGRACAARTPWCCGSRARTTTPRSRSSPSSPSRSAAGSSTSSSPRATCPSRSRSSCSS
jgi:hypothetical protein